MSLPALDLRDPNLASEISGRSLVISASAGSGKTFALVSLVLGFLGSGGRAPQVVATTFGREAAADLRSRILLPLDQLSTWNVDRWEDAIRALRKDWEAWDTWLDDLEPKVRPEIAVAARQWVCSGTPLWMDSPRLARQHWIRARREAELLQATTVHSLAISILRLGGQGGGSVSQLVEAKDPALLRLLRSAGREMLNLSEADPDAPAARRLWAWCEGFEENQDRWNALASAFDGHLDALGTWRSATDSAQIRESLLLEGRRVLTAYAPFAEAPLSAAALTKKGKAHANFTKIGLAKVQPEPEGEVPMRTLLDVLERLASRFLTANGHNVLTYYSEDFQLALKPLLDELPAHLEAWMTLLLERVFQAFRDLKAERGLQSYGDLVREASAWLQRHPDFDPPAMLIVDEYQDVNPVQQAFLETLGASRTVLVGDPKQAIYGFRGGIPELLQAKLQKAAGRGEAFRLPANHRSSAPVVELANAFVRDVIPKLDPASVDEDGVQTHSARGKLDLQVALAALPSTKVRGGDLLAGSAWIAALSKENGWEAAGFGSAEPGTRRRALLLPRRTGLPALRRVLQAAHVEPLVQGREGFWESPGVRLIMALLESVAQAEASLPRLAVLRSPWVGATDPELVALQQGGLEASSQKIREGFLWLGRLRVLSTQGIVAEGLTRPGLLELLGSTQVHGALEPARSRRNLERFLGWVPALPAVPALAWAELRQRRSFEDPGDAPAEDAAADLVVQTVHSAKGLEYDDVILPMLADQVKGVRKGVVRQRPDGNHDLWIGWKLGHARGPALQEIRGEEDRRAFREGLNLLYVGLTRAKDRMLLLQQWPEKDGIAEPPASGADRLAGKKSVCWHHVATDLADAYASLRRLEGAAPAIASSTLGFRSILFPPTREVIPHSSNLAPAAPVVASARARKGIQLHALVREVLVREAVDPDAARAYLAAHPLLRSWPEAEAMTLDLLVQLQARGWGTLPRRTEFELPGVGKSGGSGRADLVIWEPDRLNPTGIILVDFKLASTFLEETLDLHRLQLNGYREALAKIVPQVPVEAWVVGLEGRIWVRLS